MILLAPVRAMGGIATWASAVRGLWVEDIIVVDTSPLGRRPSQSLSVGLAMLALLGGTWVWGRALVHALRTGDGIWVTVAPSIGYRVRDVPFVCLSKALHVRTVIHIHGSLMPGLLGKSFLARRWARWGLRAAGEVVALDARTQGELARVSGRRVHRLPNFVEVSDDRVTPRSRVSRVLFVGRVSSAKGSDVLTKLAEMDSADVELRVVGPLDPSIAAGFRRECERLGVGLTGELSSFEVRREMLNADVLLLPSHHEGFPMVVLEAMSVGLPVIASDVGACREMLEEGDEGSAGVVVPSPLEIGPAQFASAVLQQISQAGWAARHLGGPERVHRRYVADRVIPSMIDILAGER